MSLVFMSAVFLLGLVECRSVFLPSHLPCFVRIRLISRVISWLFIEKHSGLVVRLCISLGLIHAVQPFSRLLFNLLKKLLEVSTSAIIQVLVDAGDHVAMVRNVINFINQALKGGPLAVIALLGASRKLSRREATPQTTRAGLRHTVLVAQVGLSAVEEAGRRVDGVAAGVKELHLSTHDVLL